MGENNQLLEEISNSRIGQDKRVIKLMYMMLSLYLTTLLVFGVVICCIVVSSNNAKTEMTRLYFETDYNYGIVTQTTDVKVGE